MFKNKKYDNDINVSLKLQKINQGRI